MHQPTPLSLKLDVGGDQIAWVSHLTAFHGLLGHTGDESLVKFFQLGFDISAGLDNFQAALAGAVDGGLNTNVQRMALNKVKELEAEGESVEVCAIGNKGLGFMQRLGANIVSQVTGLGDKPRVDQLVGPVKVMLDGYIHDRFDRLLIIYTKFVNTMKQEALVEQVLPLAGDALGTPAGTWDYIYEPDAKVVLDQILARYIEALIYQSVAENMASEQSARMVAMKAASDNAGSVIDELTLIYNKTRQASITKELSEIVGGAAAV